MPNKLPKDDPGRGGWFFPFYVGPKLIVPVQEPDSFEVCWDRVIDMRKKDALESRAS